jgi:predicted transglutaminase-like protease
MKVKTLLCWIPILGFAFVNAETESWDDQWELSMIRYHMTCAAVLIVIDLAFVLWATHSLNC